LFFSFASEYIRNVHENQEEPKLNGTNQLLFYAYGINLPGKNISMIHKNTAALLVTSN
jgi:hypothetical protein